MKLRVSDQRADEINSIMYRQKKLWLQRQLLMLLHDRSTMLGEIDRLKKAKK